MKSSQLDFMAQPVRPKRLDNSLLGHSFLDLRRHLPGLGETTVGFLRVDQLTVERDLEDAVLALDQGRLDVEVLGDLVRQTGGSGLVVSNDAVFDLHGGHVGSSVSSGKDSRP